MLPPSPTSSDLEQISKKLRKLISKAPDSELEDKLVAVRKDILAWDKEGRLGELPHAAELQEWGIWPPEPAPVETVASNPADPGEGLQTGTDPDGDLQPEYETALILISDPHKEYYQAVKILENLRTQAKSRLVEPIRQNLLNARIELQRATIELILAARSVSEDYPDDADLQEKAWKKVLKVNPEAPEALQNLDRLPLLRLANEIRASLQDIVKQAESAAERKRGDLPRLNRLLGQVEAWNKEGEKGNLPPDLFTDVIQAHHQIAELRKSVRDRLGIASTKFVEGDMREAYRSLREQIDEGVPAVPDYGNLLGRGMGQDAPTYELWDYIRKAFLSSLRAKVNEHIEKARQEVGPNPETALQTLQEVLSWLEDRVLVEDDRREFETELHLVNREIKEVEGRLIAFEEAGKLIREAQSGTKTAQQRLNLLVQARERYPEYPTLNEATQNARLQLAEELANQVHRDIILAQQQVNERAQFDLALQTLSEARQRISTWRDLPRVTGSTLGQVLERLDQEIDGMLKAQQSFNTTLEIVHQAEEAIARYDEDGDARHLDLARGLVEQIDEAQRKRADVANIQAMLTMRQSDMLNWRDGMDEYNSARWESAEGYLNRITRKAANWDEAQVYLRRARAARWALEAEQLEEREQFQEALGHFKACRDALVEVTPDGLTQLFYEAGLEGISRLEAFEKNNHHIAGLIAQSRFVMRNVANSLNSRASLRSKLDPVDDLKKLITELKEVQPAFSSQREQVTRALDNARATLRDVYLAGIKDASEIEDFTLLSMAYRLANELEQGGLLEKPEHLALANKVQFRYLEAENQRLLTPPDPDWREILNNRRRAWQLADAGLKPEIAKELRHTFREATYSEYRRRLYEKQQGMQYLTRLLETSDLALSDPLIIQTYIAECIFEGIWEEARHAIHLLALAEIENSQELEQTWLGIWRAAEALAARDFTYALQQFEILIKDYPGLKELIQDQRRRLIGYHVDRLRGLWDAAIKVKTEASIMSALECFLLIQRLEPDSFYIEEYRNQVLIALADICPDIFQRAENVTLWQFSENEMRQRMNLLSSYLQMLNDLLPQLNRDSSYMVLLRSTPAVLNRLNNRIKIYNQATAILDEFDFSLAAAVCSASSQGWNFNDPVRYLNAAREVADDFSILVTRLHRAQALLAQSIDFAESLTRTSHKLLENIEQEDFSLVITLADELERLWAGTLKSPLRWDGIEALIEYSYLQPLARVNSLAEHQDTARKQQLNLHIWQEWHNQMEIQYRDFQAIVLPFTNMRDRLYPSLPIRRFIPALEQAGDTCREFLSIIAERPQERPLSQKAKTLAKQWDELEIEHLVHDSDKTIRTLLENEHKKLMHLEEADGPLHRLRLTRQNINNLKLSGKIPDLALAVANHYLQMCIQIDPLDQEIHDFWDELHALTNEPRDGK